MEEPTINSVQFDQGCGLFACCKNNGLTIYNVNPLVEKCHFNGDITGSVGMCEIAGRSNLFVIVSGGRDLKYPDNVLVVYDDLEKRARLKITFPTSIRRMCCRKDRLVVALLNHIYVYSFPSPVNCVFQIKTIENPRGILEMSSDESNKQLMVFPGPKADRELQIVDLSVVDRNVSSGPNWIPAHRNPLRVVALNNQSSMVATASTNGTLIRVWDLVTKTQLVEIRRGSDSAQIYCLNFSPQSEFLCCSSDKGTVHIFAVLNEDLNKRNFVGQALSSAGYSNASYSCVNFTVPQEISCVCGFTEKNEVIAICIDGTYHKYVFSIDNSGKIIISREAFDVYLDVCDDDADLIS